MRALKPFLTGVLLLGIVAGCHEPAKVTQREAAIAAQTTEQMNTSAAAVARSRYRTYRWMTDEEMVRYRLGYDPSMDAGTRYAVEQAVNDDLADKGFQRGEPADFVVAFSDVYIDRNRSDPGWPFEARVSTPSKASAGSQMEAYNDMEVYRTPEEAFTIVFLDAQTCCAAVARHGTRALPHHGGPAERRGDRNRRVMPSMTCRCRWHRDAVGQFLQP